MFKTQFSHLGQVSSLPHFVYYQASMHSMPVKCADELFVIVLITALTRLISAADSGWTIAYRRAWCTLEYISFIVYRVYSGRLMVINDISGWSQCTVCVVWYVGEHNNDECRKNDWFLMDVTAAEFRQKPHLCSYYSRQEEINICLVEWPRDAVWTRQYFILCTQLNSLTCH